MSLFGGLTIVSLFLPAGGNIALKIFRVLFSSRLIFLIFGYFLSLAINKKRKVYYFLASVFFIACELYLCVESFWINSIYFLFIATLIILCLNNLIKFLEIRVLQILGTYSLFIYLIHQEIGYIIIDSINNYWLGATVASLTMLFIGILFGIGYNFVLNYIKRLIQKRKIDKL